MEGLLVGGLAPKCAETCAVTERGYTNPAVQRSSPSTDNRTTGII